MPSSANFKCTSAVVGFLKSIFAPKRFPVDLTLTKISFSNSLLSTNKFKLSKKIIFFPNFSLGPTIISFFF